MTYSFSPKILADDESNRMNLQSLERSDLFIAIKSAYSDCADPACHDAQDMFKKATAAVSSNIRLVVTNLIRESSKTAGCIYAEGK